MDNDQVIGVPRELLELCWLTLVDNSSYADDVRALLDADKVNNRQMGLMEFVEAHPIKPAAQPQDYSLTYSSTQATACAGCSKIKHTPLRVDAMGGYVCLTCIDERLEKLLDAEAQPQGEPVAWQYRVNAGPQTGWSLWHEGKGEEFKKSYQVETRPLYAEQPSPGAVVAVVHPFAEKVIRKLQRFQACAEDGQGTDIGRHWFDLLTQLGLLNRVQRSPALWEMTQQGEDALKFLRAKP